MYVATHAVLAGAAAPARNHVQLHAQVGVVTAKGPTPRQLVPQVLLVGLRRVVEQPVQGRSQVRVPVAKACPQDHVSSPGATSLVSQGSHVLVTPAPF